MDEPNGALAEAADAIAGEQTRVDKETVLGKMALGPEVTQAAQALLGNDMKPASEVPNPKTDTGFRDQLRTSKPPEQTSK